MLLIFRLIIVFFIAMMVIPVMASVPFNGGRGANNIGAFADVAIPQTPALVWKATIYNGADSPSNVIITDGLVITAFGRNLVAVTAETGERRWTQTLPLAPLEDILFLDGKLIISMTNGVVQARVPLTGEVVWQTTLNTSIVNGPTFDEQYLFYALKSSGIQLIEQHSGKLLNPLTLGHEIAGSPLPQGNNLQLTYLDNTQARIEMNDGRAYQRWSAKLPSTPLPITATADGNQVYVPVSGGIIAIDGNDATNPISWRYAGDLLPFPLTLDGNMLYATTRSGLLLAVDAATGKDIWKRTTRDGKTLPGSVLPASATASPLVLGNLLVVRMKNGILGIFTKDNGKLLWLYRVPGVHQTLKFGVPGVNGNDFYMATSAGSLLKMSSVAPDVDGPQMSSTQLLNWNEGVNDVKMLRYLGATIEDEGSSVQVGQVTCMLDGTDFSRSLQYNAKSSFYYLELNPSVPLSVGMHRLVMTAKDCRGNVSIFTRSFLVGDKSGAVTEITINGDYFPNEATIIPGTIVVWHNTTGAVRTVVADDGSFTSDTLFPQGIPDGEVFAWVAPATLEAGKRLAYHCRIKGAAANGALLVGN